MEYSFYDKFLYPLRMVEATQSDGRKTFLDDRAIGNQLVIDEGGGDTVIDLSAFDTLPQVFWAHKDTSSDVSNWPGLYTSIETAINNQMTASYSIETHTPTGSSVPDCGIRINGNTSFTVRWSDPATTIDPRVLGFPEGQSADVGSNGFNNINSPVSYLGAWFPYDSAGASSVIHDHRREPYTIQATSDSSSNAYSIGWKSGQRRRNDYFNLAGPHTFWTRGLRSEETSRAGLADGDTNNALEDLWQASNILRSGRKSDILAIYGEDPDLSGAVAGSWEVVRLGQSSERGRMFGDVIFDIDGSDGERYRVEMTTDIKQSDWRH